MITDRKLPDFWQNPVTELPDTPQISPDDLKAVFDSNTNELKPNFNGLINDLAGAGGASEIGASELYANDPSGTNVQAKLEAVYNIAKDAVAGGIPDRSISGIKLEAGAVSENELSSETVSAFVKKEGAVMTGELVLADYPQNSMGAVPKDMLQNFSRIKNRITTTYNQSIAAGASVIKKLPHGGSFITITNSLTNPSFENTSFWQTSSQINYSTDYALDGTRSMRVNFSTGTGILSNNMTLPLNHVYYAFSNWKVINCPRACLSCSIRRVSGNYLYATLEPTITGASDWTRYSKVFTHTTSADIKIEMGAWTADGLTVVDAYLDGMSIIDLTAAFGAGNEPTKAWCDANIPFFTGSYDIMITPSTLAYPDRAKLFFKSGITKGVRTAVEINRDTDGNYHCCASGSSYQNISGTTGFSGPVWLTNSTGKIFYEEGTGTNYANFGASSLGATNFTMYVTVDDLYINLNITNTDTSSQTLTTTVTAEVY